jgi:adenylate cyclase
MGDQITGSTTLCPTCGTDLRAKARFCDGCGSAVVANRSAGERKQVTVLFTDVVGSMKLAATLDPERLQEIMHEVFNRAAAVVQRYGGTVDKFTGDGLMALFGAPAALEDHALRACIAALEIQATAEVLAAELLRRDDIELQIRVGLNSGEVIAGEIGAAYTAVGHPVGMAQRMEAAAPPGGVLCSQSTAALVERATRLGPVESVAIKGADEPVQARRLESVLADQLVMGRDEGAMLGRDADLRTLRDAFDAADASLIGVVGAPGIGKSRLIREFATWAGGTGADVVVARCEAHTTDVAYRAFARMVRAMFGIGAVTGAAAREHTAAQLATFLAPDSDDAQILYDILGIADPQAAPPEVSVDSRRHRLVAVLAEATRARPVRTVFVLEDAHWIDASSDAALAEFATALRATQSAIVTSYRPEYRGALREHSDAVVTLHPLTAETTTGLVAQIVGPNPTLAGLAERIAAPAAGNPFFVEEIVRDLAGRGVLAGSRGDYRLDGDIEQITVPATVQSVLAARVDRLPVQAKSILNAASVIGSQFDVDTLTALLPDMDAADLIQLVSAELIDQTQFVPRQRYCFRHPLVRKVAYESQLTATRAAAHTRLADAIATRDPDTVEENAALIATHLEAAGEAAQAYEWHMRAAEWMRLRDLAAARASWEHARGIAEHLPGDLENVDAMRIAPRTMLTTTAYFVADEYDTDEGYREFRELATKSGDILSLALATSGQVISLFSSQLRLPDAAALAAELVEMVDRIDCDVATELELIRSVMLAQYLSCDFDRALRTIERHHRLSDDSTSIPVVNATCTRGAIRVWRADYEQGRHDMRIATEQARGLNPVAGIQVLFSRLLLVPAGLETADEVVSETAEALRRCESFGDPWGLTLAQWLHAMVLLRCSEPATAQATDLLEQARARIDRHQTLTATLGMIEADLALVSGRHSDDAIEQLRAQFGRYIASGSPLVTGSVAEALVQLLLERGSADDLVDARGVIDNWESQTRAAPIPGLDLWRLRCRAMVAKAEGNDAAYAEVARQFLTLAESHDARVEII